MLIRRGGVLATNASTNSQAPVVRRLLARSSPGQPGNNELFRLEAVGCELIAVEIADIGRIGTRMPAARPGRTFVLAAGRESSLVEFCHRRTAWRDEADRAAIGECRRLSIGRLQHEEFRGCFAPDRAVVAPIVHRLVAECADPAVIKGARLRKVVRPHRDMRKNWHLILLKTQAPRSNAPPADYRFRKEG